MDSIKENVAKCPDCGNTDLINDDQRGEIICNICGLVVSQRLINTDAEWRAFTSEEKRRKVRTGPPMNPSLADKGLSTIIGKENKDAYGNFISPRIKAEIDRLRKWNIRFTKYAEKGRNLIIATNILELLVAQLKLSKSIKDGAIAVYRKLLIKNLIKGRTIEGMMIASIYFVCRFRGIPIKWEDFGGYTELTNRHLVRCYLIILQALNININITPAESFISRFCSELNLSNLIQESALKLLKLINKSINTSGKDPKGLAGAVIYIASIQHTETKSQKKIAEVAGIADWTLRKRVKEIRQLL